MRSVRLLFARLFLLALFIFFEHPAAGQSARGTNGGAFSFATDRVVVSETDGNAYLTITRNSEIGKMLVDVISKDNTATNGVDYRFNPATNTIRFRNLETEATLVIPITDNTKTNAQGSVAAGFTLANPRPALDEDQNIQGTLGKPSSSQLVILDNDRELEFNLDKSWYQVFEPQPTNTTTLTVNVTLAKPPTDQSSEVSVDYQVTVDNSINAKPGSDYATPGADFEEIASGNLAFGPNDVSLPIVITINSDELLEFNEDFHIILKTAHGKLTVDTSGGGASGGTDSGGAGAGATMDLPYKLGKVSEATVTILFNGLPPQQLAAGSVDLFFNPDNQPSTTPAFNPSPGANRTVSSVGIDATGNVIVGGNFTGFNGVSVGGIVRLTPFGAVDPTFVVLGGANDFVSAVAVYTNGVDSGKVVLAGGFTSVSGVQRNGIARLNADGSVDLGFDPGTGADAPIYALALQRDGSLLIGGDFTQFNGIPRGGIARITASGALDTAFNPGSGADGSVYAIAPLLPDPIVFTNTAPPGDPALFTRDISVPAPSGFLTLTYNFFSDSNNLVVLSGTNQIYSSGLVAHAVLTNNPDGTVSTNFIPSVVGIPFTGSMLQIQVNTTTNAGTNWSFSVRIDPDLVLGAVIGGDFHNFDDAPHGRIAKLGTNGVSDRQFNIATGVGADDTVRAITFQRGRVVLGGAFQTFNSFDAHGVAALNTDGSFDRNFATGSGAQDGDVRVLQATPDDKIFVAGSFTFFNQTRRIFLTRLLPDGPVDTSFLDPSFNQFAGFPDPAGGWPSGVINSLALDPTNNVIVAGSFSMVGGGAFSREEIHPRKNIARLHGGASPGPGNFTFEQNKFGTDESSGALVVTLVRTDGALGSGHVGLSTFDGAAQSPIDYFGITNAPVSWISAGPQVSDGAINNQFKSVLINDDSLVEGDETFLLHLDQPQSDLILGGEFIPAGFALGLIQKATATIIDDDVPPSVISFAQTEYDFDENDGSVSITVVRTGDLSNDVFVRFATVQDTGPNAATPNADYTPVNGRLDFGSGQSSKTFTVALKNDDSVEPDETLKLVLTSPPGSGAILGTNSTAVLAIIDNDYLPGHVNLSATNYAVTEGQAAQITVRRTGGNVGVLQVNYSTAADSATPADFIEVSGTLQWNDGDSAPQVISIPTTDDTRAQGSRDFSIRLFRANPAQAIGPRTNATVTILDNDSLGTFAFNAAEYLADENGTNTIINVVRRGGSAETAKVTFSTQTLTNFPALVGDDYQLTNGVLTFLPGETSKSFAVRLNDNLTVDPERRIGLVLSDPQPAGASLGVLSTAFITIIDNEAVNIPAGSVETDFGTDTGANAAVHAIALQNDGRILLGGDFTIVNRQVRTHLARLNSDSSVDTSFGTDYVIDDSVRAIAVQSDNRVLIAGDFTKVNSLPNSRLARVSSAGTLDSTFNVGSGADNPIFALKESFVAGQRKILVGGQFSFFNGQPRRGIARVENDGRTDLTFNPGTGADGPVYALAVQRDGKILIGGAFTTVNNIARQNLARLNTDGSVDAAFDAGVEGSGAIRAIALQFDDKILLGGLFRSAGGGVSQNVARLNPDGSLDTTFDPGLGSDSSVYSITLQLDGKILLAGDFGIINNIFENRIARLNSDGSVDPSANFGSGANGYVAALAVQPDRRILAGGGFTTFDSLPRNGFARLYGGSIKGAGAFEFAAPNFTASQADGNALITVRRTGGLLGSVTVDYSTHLGTAIPGLDYTNVSGRLIFATGENLQGFFVPLLNNDLTDPAKTVQLTLANPQGGAILGNQPVATLTIVSDNSMLGFSELSYSVNESAPAALIQIVRDGDLSAPASALFTATGITATDGEDFLSLSTNVPFAAGQKIAFVPVPILDDLAVEDNETIELRLSSPAGAQLGRSLATLIIIDNDVAPGLFSISPVSPASESAPGVLVTVLRRRGKTGVVSVNYATSDGTATAGQDYIAVAGTLQFQEGEIAKSFFVPFINDTLPESDETFTITLSNAAGGAEIASPTAQVLIVDDDIRPGSLDKAFNPGDGANAEVRAVKTDSANRILIAGSFTAFNGLNRSRIARLNGQGGADTTFDPGAGPDASVVDLAPDPAGRVLIGGQFNTVRGIVLNRVARLKTDGSPDATFSLPLGLNAEVSRVLLQPDGKILVAGTFDVADAATFNHIARLNSDGTIDLTFSPGAGPDGPVTALALQGDGKILIGGSFNHVAGLTRSGVARLNPNGPPDPSFNSTGTGATSSPVQDIAVLPQGQVLIVGDFSAYNGVPRSRIARLNADGGLDLAFNPGPGPNAIIYAVAPQSDGKIIIVGDFTSVGGTPRNRIARFNQEGSHDIAFDPGAGANDTVLAVTLQPADGKILIAGRFTQFDNQPRSRITRLNNDAPSSAPAAVTFAPIARVGDKLRLAIPTQSGLSYTLESTTVLGASWRTEQTVTAQATATTFDITPSANAQFFRIRQ